MVNDMAGLGFLRRIVQRGQHPLGRNTLWLTLGEVCRHGLRAIYFLIIARFLGAEQYGIFVGVAALVAVFGPFAAFGSGSLLLKHVSQDRSVFRNYWGNSLLVILSVGSLLSVLGLLVGRILLPAHVPTLLVGIVALADLIFQKLIDTSATCFQAFDMLGVTAQINICAALARLIAAVAIIGLIDRPSALQWAVFYCIGAVAAASVAVGLVNRRLGLPKLATHLIAPEAVERFYFSCGLSTETVYNDIDKTMLTEFSVFEGAGIYAAAYRIIDVAFVPFNALLCASYSRFFVYGSAGIERTSRYATRLLSRAVGFAILAWLAVFMCAPLVPRLLGPDYVQAVHALRWLAPIPLLRTVHRFLANSLTGAGFQGIRTAVQAAVAVFNIVINLWLIPSYSWLGAAWSSLCSDGLLMVLLALITVWLRRQDHIRTAEVAPTVA